MQDAGYKKQEALAMLSRIVILTFFEYIPGNVALISSARDMNRAERRLYGRKR